MKFKVMLLPGDGIGPEVVASAVKVMELVGSKFGYEFEYQQGLIGGCSYDKYQIPLTDEVINKCFESDFVLLGAVGGYQWENLPHNLKPEAALLKIRKSLGLFNNIRPAKVFDSMLDSSSLKPDVLAGTDIVILRELTGDLYFGEPRGYDDEKGWNTMIYYKNEVERIAQQAFEIALKRNKKVCSVDKANVLETSQFWRKIVVEIAKNYPDVELSHMYVDNAAMQLVRNPKQFDVILTQNMFGDILSDIAAMITGSLGMLPSASLGEKYALYEPVHGSAPDIAGKGIANPIATILSVGMAFTYSMNCKEAEDLINKAVDNVLNKGFRTQDIYNEKENHKLVNTEEMTNLIISEISRS